MDLDRLIGARHLPHNETDRVHLLGWQEPNGDVVPTNLAVSNVDVDVDLANEVVLDERMLSAPLNQQALLTQSEILALDETARSAAQTASSAFDRWLAVIRWKAKDATIGRGSLLVRQTVHDTRLLAKPALAPVWSGSLAVTLVFKEPMTAAEWDQAGAVLSAGGASPVYWSTFFDAVAHLHTQELNTATVQLAVAAEVFLRSRIAVSLPAQLSASLREYIDDMNIRPLMTKAFPDLLAPSGSSSFEKLLSTLHGMFDARNHIMHSGASPAVSPARTDSFRDAVRALMEFEESPAYWR